MTSDVRFRRKEDRREVAGREALLMRVTQWLQGRGASSTSPREAARTLEVPHAVIDRAFDELVLRGVAVRDREGDCRLLAPPGSGPAS